MNTQNEQLIELMKQHKQTDSETIYDHGCAVWKYTKKLITGDISDMRIPQWYHDYKDQILATIPDLETIETYCIYHDIGKCFCLEIGADGKRHFPDHAEKSYEKWVELSDKDTSKRDLIAKLIRNDMLFHSEDAETIFSKKLSPEITSTLVLSALAAIHANADSFGRDSDSFKIKLKQLDKRAKKVLEETFDHPYVYAIVRNDLSNAQKAVQIGHALIESTRNFNMNGCHPSVILCVVKSEKKLDELTERLSSMKIKFSAFREPDIGDQLTAIATQPLRGNERTPFKHFQLLY